MPVALSSRIQGITLLRLAGGFDSNRRLASETDCYEYDDDSDLEDFDTPEGSQPISRDVSDGASGDTDNDTSADHGSIENKGARKIATDMAYNVAISDIAFTTWQALMHYIYTGTINFAPLRSRGISERNQAIKDHHEANPDQPTLCSPKSIYRVADIVGLEKLKNLAKEDIRQKLSSHTIVDETFSYISSLYPDVLDMQLTYLYDKGLISQVMPAMQRKLHDTAGMEMQQVVNVMGAIILRLSLLLVKQQAQENDCASNSNGLLQSSNNDSQPSSQPILNDTNSSPYKLAFINYGVSSAQSAFGE
ncbi:hypothetical protein EIP86_000894 [Pleurotus ostreatoroseus]|nr:hypothetical protein EIP86_000894 [Pleurotus ostreatoroseus]